MTPRTLWFVLVLGSLFTVSALRATAQEQQLQRHMAEEHFRDDGTWYRVRVDGHPVSPERLAAQERRLAKRVPKEFVRVDGNWYRVYDGQNLRVHREWITVKFRSPDMTFRTFQRAVREQNRSLAGLLGNLEVIRSNFFGHYHLRITDGADVFDVLRVLRATGYVEFAEEQVYCLRPLDTTPPPYPPNDPGFPSQWNLENTGQLLGTPDSDVDAPDGWNLETGDPSVIIAVCDTGVHVDHADLAENVIGGWDFANNCPDPRGCNRYNNHGTLVSGIIAARINNNIGVAGVAGGFSTDDGCRIMPLVIQEKIVYIAANLADAVAYATQQGARVINMSTFACPCACLDDALEQAYNNGVLLVAAAGNSTSCPSPPGSNVSYPATHPDVMAVASTNKHDQRAYQSSCGSEIEVAAPGEEVLSTSFSEPGSVYIFQGVTDDYHLATGTSFAAPHVSALAGLLFSMEPNLCNDAVRQIIKDSAESLGPAHKFGQGRINVHYALSMVETLPSHCPQ